MGTLGIISLVLGILGLASGAGVSIMNAQKNERLVRETNEANLQAVRETNASNVEQAELAYTRSLPINQVNNMMAAGMSKTAAIQSLSGGGTYQAPVLQSAHADAPQSDYSGVASALERLGNIPSNAEQFNLQQMQRRNLDQEYELRQNEERRKQEMHNALIDEKNYSKWERESMDSFMSLMENTAQEKNIQPSPNQSMHDYVRALGLQDNEMYKKLPVSARQRAFDKFKQIQDEKRAQVSSSDAHDIAVKNKTILGNQIKEWHDAKDAREKENKARALEASLRSITAEMGLADADFEESLKYYLDDRGVLKLGYVQQGSRHLQHDANAIWDAIFSVIPIKSLGKNLLEGLVHIGG